MLSKQEKSKLTEDVIVALRSSGLPPEVLKLSLIHLRGLLEGFIDIITRHYVPMVRVVHNACPDKDKAEQIISKVCTALNVLLAAGMQEIGEMIGTETISPSISLEMQSVSDRLMARVTTLVDAGVDVNAAMIQAVDELIPDEKVREIFLAKVHVVAIAAGTVGGLGNMSFAGGAEK